MENQDSACAESPYIAWSDPDFVEKFGAIALRNYRRLREEKIAASTLPKPEAEPAPMSGRDVFSIGPENLPEKFIDRQTYETLMRTRCELRSLVDLVPPEIDDPCSAICLLARYGLCWCGYELAQRTVCFLTCEWRFHQDYRLLTDAVGFLDIASQSGGFMKSLQITLCYAQAANRAFPLLEPYATYAAAFNALHFVANCYFTLVQGVFPRPEVIRCRNVFSGLLFNFNKVESVAECDRFRECAEVMFRAIAAEEREAVKARKRSKEDGQHPADDANPPPVRKAFDDNIMRILEAGMSILRKMDYNVDQIGCRQVDEISRRHNSQKKLAQLMNGKESVLCRDVIKVATDNPDELPQLTRLKEPRLSQVKVVIECTKKDPIVPVSPNPRSGDRTLGKAVDAACRANRDKLPQDPVAIKRLKSCCYDLAKKYPDLFHYRVDH